ncbi:hypothetical protein TCAL_14600 [Tigriopus californicus]|uniref:MAM domain-containing protein n=1 Tax=Tigriopus californicus TaxID=6832 RepID=A0A553PDC9_TIGCA|nr:hypothetical protein TCAL_14600 [Tigriopus californicus]
MSSLPDTPVINQTLLNFKAALRTDDTPLPDLDSINDIQVLKRQACHSDSENGDGFFLYLNATANSPGMVSTLRSPPFYAHVRQCLSINAMVPSGSISVFFGPQDNRNQTELLQVRPDLFRGWVLAQAQIDELENAPQFITIEGVLGEKDLDLVLGSIQIWDGSCDERDSYEFELRFPYEKWN